MSTLEKHIEDYHSYMRLKNYSKQTVMSYLRTVRMFYEYRSQFKLRGRISEEHARKYLLMRIDSGCSWSTINCHPIRCTRFLRFKVHRTLPGMGRIAQESALRKYFQNVINAGWSIKKIPRPQKERTLPEILSQKEVVKLIECAPKSQAP